MTNRSQPAVDRSKTSRRDFIRASSLLMAGGAVPGGLSLPQSAHAYGGDLIRVGLIGCGRRGIKAAVQMLNTASGPVQLVAMGDLFADKLQRAYRSIKGQHADKTVVGNECRYCGFDAYQKVLSCDVDVIILATPPGFRPLHFEAAVQAGKHVFMEPPIAVDAPGVRRVLTANEVARHQNLAVAVGLQRRHEPVYQQVIAQLQQGAIGDFVSCRTYWNTGGHRMTARRAQQTELEYQLRNWQDFNWLGGDQIVEQHLHGLDVMNWMTNSHPVQANGQGGRAPRESSRNGRGFDHHFVEFAYDNGLRLFSQCRRLDGCWNNISEFVQGTKGSANIGNGTIYDRQGERIWRKQTRREGFQRQQHDFVGALRAGKRPNEVDEGATSTMTGILGRMATYSGQCVRWEDALCSNRSLADFDQLGRLDQAVPVSPNSDGHNAIA